VSRIEVNPRCRQDFPALNRRWNGGPYVYFDGPAGTQVPEGVIDAVSDYYRTCNANTGGQFVTSQESDQWMRRVREAVAAFLNAPSWREISFGANMTSLTFALSRALVRHMEPGDEILVSQLDHEANRGPWLGLRERGIVVKEIAVRPDATLDAEDFARQISDRTRLVAVGAASNAFGTVNDLALARRLSAQVGAWLLVDAVHYAPHFAVDVQALEVDFLLCSAYKFYGPHVGILYSRPGLLDSLETDRLITQYAEAPYRVETGTLNHAALAGVGAAVEYLASWGQGEDLRARLVSALASIGAHEQALARSYYEQVQELPGVRVHGPGFAAGRRAPTVSITVEGKTAKEVAHGLAEQGIAVWDGDFYARRAMEILGLDKGGGVVRTGISMYNTAAEVERLVQGLKALGP
jgi:cysteine desulfurase family protein (TIGR01976 family)